MPKVPPPPAEAARALVSAAAGAVTKYVTRATAAASKWATEAPAAAGTWHSAVSAAPARERFAANTRAAGAAGFSRGVSEKGQARFGPGVAAGEAKYTRNVARFFTILSTLTYPARGLRGAAQNIERVRAVTTALHAARTGGGAATS